MAIQCERCKAKTVTKRGGAKGTGEGKWDEGNEAEAREEARDDRDGSREKIQKKK